MPITTDREYRSVFQPLAVVTDSKKLDTDFYTEGFATTFDEPYLLYEFDGVKYWEKIDRHALDEADMSDVIMQFDHAGRVFARNSNETLFIEPQDHGLFMAADLSKTKGAQELYQEISAGLITKMSWGFSIAAEEYDQDTRTRIIKKVKKVYDVSAVSLPANEDTEISARSFAEGRHEAELREAQELADRRKRIKLFMEV